jgi:superfamily II DNA or RNA helicase
MSTSVDRRGYCVSLNTLSSETLDEIKKDTILYPVVPKGYQQHNPQPFKNIRKNNQNTLILPKYYGLQKFGLPTYDNLSDGTPITVEFHGSLTETQQSCVQTYLSYAQNDTYKGGIISLGCGSGKTVLSLAIVSQLQRKTMIIVHKNFLLRQWENQIRNFLPGAKIGFIQGKIFSIENKDIVIASLPTLCKRNYSFHDFGCVIVDEVHHMAAGTFSKALPKINFRYALGLSATVDRKDRLEPIFIQHIGPIVYTKSQTYQEIWAVQDVYDNPNDRTYQEIPKLNNDMPNVSRMVNNVCEYTPRTEYIASLINDLIKREHGRCCIVFSERRNHLRDIASYLQTDSIGYCVGGMNEDDVQKQDGKQVVLCTYAMASEGMDMKMLDTVILASPKKDIEQSVGRILRKPPEERIYTPLIIDIVDAFGSFTGQAKERKRFYKKNQYTLFNTYNSYINSLL